GLKMYSIRALTLSQTAAAHADWRRDSLCVAIEGNDGFKRTSNPTVGQTESPMPKARQLT
ncbi:MAG: hypothetical protein Q7N50_13625, partial [Armatimonadota bacterium]|nr:hypothetical protein [Armatimonadota bacterium]